MSVAFVFPGQGSQKIGMGASVINSFASCLSTVNVIEDVVGCKILDLMMDGPLEKLNRTKYAQLAIFTVSITLYRLLLEEYNLDMSKIAYVAGHSLGEYTALCASGVLSLEEAAFLVKKRGELMEDAVAETDGAMCAIIGLQYKQVLELIKKYESGNYVVQIANDNSSAQCVISGHRTAVVDCAECAKSVGAKNTIMLNTSGAFHTKLMSNAAVLLDYELKNINFKEQKVPIIFNVTGTTLPNTSKIPSAMVAQMVNTVKWRESMKYCILQGVTNIIEIGDSTVLTKMTKRDYPDITMTTLNSVQAIDDFIKDTAIR